MTIEFLLGLPKEGFDAINQMSDEALKLYLGDIVTTESALKDSGFIYKKMEEINSDPSNPVNKMKRAKKIKLSAKDKFAAERAEMDDLMKELDIV